MGAKRWGRILISTPDNPFLFTFDGVIPALKNSRTADHRASPEVDNWYKAQKPHVLKQREAQAELDIITGFAYCRFEYFYPGRMPKGDLDNCYTTVQELLQKPSAPSVVRKHKGILGVVPNDKQVCGYAPICLPLGERPIISAYLWVWAFDEAIDDIEQLNIFKAHRQSNLDKRTKKQTFPSIFRR